jgi:hypothetical protein
MARQAIADFRRHLQRALEHRREVDGYSLADRWSKGLEVSQVELVVFAIDTAEFTGYKRSGRPG